jgi:hypothetical protein
MRLLLGVGAYLHISSGRWQWRCDDVHAVVELRDRRTHVTLLQMPAELAVVALLHYGGQAQLVAALVPRVPELRTGRGPRASDTGQPRLRGAEKRHLRGRNRPKATI